MIFWLIALVVMADDISAIASVVMTDYGGVPLFFVMILRWVGPL
jgi:hypothetical protein